MTRDEPHEVSLFGKLKLPLMCAPMSRASSIPLALACCGAGIVGGWQGGTVCSVDELERYLIALDEASRQGEDEGSSWGPPIVNFPARMVDDPDDGAAKLGLCSKYRPPLVLTSMGDPTELVKRAHDWGARVIGDTVTVRHAEKAIAAGVDGLMLTCSGAGGQTGSLTPFAFVPKIRAMYGGLLVVAGGIASASGIAAALALGADLAAMGTRFIATPESAVAAGHREMIVEVDIDDIVVTNAMNGVPGSYMRSSIRAFGLDPNNLAPLADAPRTQRPERTNLHLWRHIFSAGQSVGLIDELLPVHAIVDRLAVEFDATAVASQGRWRTRLEELWSM